MVNYLDIITTVSSVLLIRSEQEENLEKKKELWQYIKTKDKYSKTWTQDFSGRIQDLPADFPF